MDVGLHMSLPSTTPAIAKQTDLQTNRLTGEVAFFLYRTRREKQSAFAKSYEKAKKKSEKCAVSIWKVRGNPKEGLYLKRIFTRKRREERKDDNQINNPTSTHKGVQERAIHRGNTMPANLYS